MHTRSAWLAIAALATGCTAGTMGSAHGTLAAGDALPRTHASYKIALLGSLGGTNSIANALTDRGWASGTSFLRKNATMHAALWMGEHAPIDLKTLGGPNSAVDWQVESVAGYVAGISETSKRDPLGESKQWSCHAFLPDNGSSGDTCLGFVWHDGKMSPLPTLGGNNAYAAGTNRGVVVAGWAETSTKDSTCVAPQQLGFLPVVWDARTLAVTKLPTLTVNGKTDPDGAATAANDRGDVVGISGICDVAVGRFTGRHAVLWHDGEPVRLKTFGAVSWNTPVAVNDNGQIAGFLNVPGAQDKKGVPTFISAFWNSATSAPVRIEPLPGDSLSQPTSINDDGVVLGVSIPSSHVYLWQNDKTTDLTKLLASAYPAFTLFGVGGINDRGEISGQACMLVGGACPTSNPTLVAFVAKPQ
jgi:uncharacterized membrane protein